MPEPTKVPSVPVPYRDIVVVQLTNPSGTSTGGIILPASAQTKSDQNLGLVVAVGKDANRDLLDKIVLAPSFGGIRAKHGDIEYALVENDTIFAMFDPNPEKEVSAKTAPKAKPKSRAKSKQNK